MNEATEPLTQIVMASGRTYIVEGTPDDVRKKLEDIAPGEMEGSFLRLTNVPAQEMFPRAEIWLRVADFEAIIEESAEAWTFQQQIEADRWAEFAQHRATNAEGG